MSALLDASSLADEALRQRLDVQEIALNLSEARLLGGDLRIPSDGYPLLTESRVIRATPNGDVALELSFPPEFAQDDDLALFLSIDQSPHLSDASVLVESRLFDRPIGKRHAPITVSPDACGIDPDTEPGGCQTHSNALLADQAVSLTLRDTDSADLVAQFGRDGALDVVITIPAVRWLTPAIGEELQQAGAEPLLLDVAAPTHALSIGSR